MEKILKIQSEQGFSETAIPAAFINSKLLDIIIPGNGTYDLSQSYINVNMEVVSFANGAGKGGNIPAGFVQSDTACYNNEIRFLQDSTNTSAYRSKCAVMVRNADMFSANRGMVESIRRVNTLREILSNVDDDKAEQHAGLDRMGALEGRRGTGNETSSLVQIIGSNCNVAGVADLTMKAQKLSRDYRIPLSDLFGVGNAQWNGDVYGDTRIHLELQPNLLQIQELGGDEGTDTYLGTAWGAIVSYNAAGSGQLPANQPLGTIASGRPLVTQIIYNNFQLKLPFYVGQAVVFNATSSVGGGVTATYVIIDAIEYNLGTNDAAQPTGTGQVQIWTRTPVYTAAGAAEDITAITIHAHTSNPTTDQIRINRAEIVLSEMVGTNGPDKINYTTYSTEEVQGNGLLRLNKQIVCEPNAQNLIVAHCNSGEIAPDRSWTDYRLAINNVDQTGNRDIPWNKPLHKDRILRFEQNRGTYPSNTSLQLLKTEETQTGAANQIDMFPILETLPITQAQKIVNLELTSAGAQDVVFYKELIRSI